MELRLDTVFVLSTEYTQRNGPKVWMGNERQEDPLFYCQKGTKREQPLILGSARILQKGQPAPLRRFYKWLNKVWLLLVVLFGLPPKSCVKAHLQVFCFICWIFRAPNSDFGVVRYFKKGILMPPQYMIYVHRHGTCQP